MDSTDHRRDSDNVINHEAITFTESLASRKSFENYLFHHKAQRRTSHSMDEFSSSLIVNRDAVLSTIPEEIRDIFGARDHEVTNIEAFQEESETLSYFFMRFSLDGDTHTITSQSDESYATYTRPNSYGDIVPYTLPPSSPLSLLASFVYIREYDAIRAREAMKQSDNDSQENLFSIEDSAIDSARIGDSDLIERLLMTLGQFDGVSQTETSGLLPAGDKILFATLRHTESPTLTHSSNELDLSVFSPSDDSPFERISLSQQLAGIKAFKSEDFDDQFGEILQNGDVKPINPNSQPSDWSKLCVEFSKTMKTELTPYEYLDETV
tara:strand:+ start:82 stop:1053 length:972 start_codon:yes stop_codon:yes gene_type:complete